MIRFLLDGEVIEVEDPDPTGTVLDYLRYTLRRTGTKEGCAEGDCGACTVLLGELDGDAVKWRAVNACILFLPMLDGKALRTVESLSRRQLHPVQRAMADGHGSQCGFCTPGFVMSLYGAQHRRGRDRGHAGQGRHRRQSVPLHRLRPDPRRPARPTRRGPPTIAKPPRCCARSRPPALGGLVRAADLGRAGRRCWSRIPRRGSSPAPPMSASG